MEIWEMVIERGMRRDVVIFENHFGFMLGRSTMEVNSLVEKAHGAL